MKNIPAAHAARLARRACASVFLFLLFTGLALAQSAYNVELPKEIDTSPDLCQYVDCASVLPEATEFSPRKGNPPYVEGFAIRDGQRALVGYVMLSTDITNIPAYSGKPVVTLIGMDTEGRFTGIRILKHSEPILLLGIPESALIKFNQQYIGKSAGDNIEVGRGRPDENIIGVDAISGATVTVIAQNQVIMTSAATTARQAGILAPEVREPAKLLDNQTTPTWEQMLLDGSVQQLTVTAQDVGLEPGEDSEPFIALQFGYLNQPDVGRAVLGDMAWKALMNRLEDGEHAIFIIRTGGRESFKGSGFVRGGLYDRVQVRQGLDTFTFRDLDYLNLYGLGAEDAPGYTESAIFIIRGGHQSATFSAAWPWKLVFLGNKLDTATGQRTFANFDQEYWLPAMYMEGGHPKITKPAPPWLRVWQTRWPHIALFCGFLLFITVVYAMRDRLTRASTNKNKWPVNAFKYAAWIFSIGYIGFHLMAQPSVTQVLAWFHSLLHDWQWTLFLTDPFLFIFWWFIIITVFIWGRGFFCGWLCPFGSLSELLYKIAGRLGLGRWQFELPAVWHNRLKWVKYAVFLGLLAVSMFSIILAEMLAEVEPFKTTFLVGILNRSWPYALFASGLLALSIFTERPFCKYLCPLGAALAMPSTFRWFGLRRKSECHTCKACAKGCGSQAIDPQGRIDMRECMLCMDCMVLYTDTHACPPLSKERKRRENEGLPLTPINAQGYFIPIAVEGAAASSSIDKNIPTDADPRMLTRPVLPPWGHLASAPRRWLHDLFDLFWPWTGEAFKRHPVLLSLTVLCSIASTCAWLAAASGWLPAASIITGWLLWSMMEVAVRMVCKPWVREGRWWQQQFRQATWFDMLCFVSLKNLLLGAGLFLSIKAAGLMAVV